MDRRVFRPRARTGPGGASDRRGRARLGQRLPLEHRTVPSPWPRTSRANSRRNTMGDERPGGGRWLRTSLGRDDEVPPAVLLPAGFALLRTGWLLFSLAHWREPVAGDAEAGEIAAYGPCPAITQGEVVLRRAPRIAVALDRYSHVRPPLQPLGVLLQNVSIRWRNRGTVQLEEHRGEMLLGVQILERLPGEDIFLCSLGTAGGSAALGGGGSDGGGGAISTVGGGGAGAGTDGCFLPQATTWTRSSTQTSALTRRIDTSPPRWKSGTDAAPTRLNRRAD